jgi:beta-hydroxylase
LAAVPQADDSDKETGSKPSPPPRLTQRRRKLVKRYGKRLIRSLTDYMGRQSYVSNDPVLPTSEFPWAHELTDHWHDIRRELDALLVHRNALPNFQDISPDQYKISPDDQWSTFVFCGFGVPSLPNQKRCPRTAEVLSRVPKLESAFFSILAPGKHVPRHRGVTKGMVRCHLALKVPKEAERCTMEVGGVNCVWKEGEVLFFDDTYPHEVTNDTDEERAVLLFDFERPMTRRGKWVSRLLMRGLRHTAYFKDALENQRAWEERSRETLPEAPLV